MALGQSADADPHRFEIVLPNSPAAAVLARRQLVAFIKHLGLKRAFIADFESAVGEALANAVEHGNANQGSLRVEVRLTEAGIEATVSDNGSGFSPRLNAVERPKAMSPRGYGLFLIQALVDAVEFRDGGKTVWFSKHF